MFRSATPWTTASLLLWRASRTVSFARQAGLVAALRLLGLDLFRELLLAAGQLAQVVLERGQLLLVLFGRRPPEFLRLLPVKFPAGTRAARSALLENLAGFAAPRSIPEGPPLRAAWPRQEFLASSDVWADCMALTASSSAGIGPAIAASPSANSAVASCSSPSYFASRCALGLGERRFPLECERATQVLALAGDQFLEGKRVAAA